MKPARKKKYVVCPCCGHTITASCKACPSCGSDERTGWSEDTYLDGIALPDDDDYDDMLRREFGEAKPLTGYSGRRWVIAVAAVLLLLMALGVMRVLW